MTARLPRVGAGERCMVIGRTGSGKTTGAVWLLSRAPGRWLVINSKGDALLEALGPSVPYDARSILAMPDDVRVAVATPATFEPEDLDRVLLELCEARAPLGIMIDELLYFHNASGRAGPGLMGLLTRGRSRGQSFIGCSQRPAAISQFCYSECDYFAVYRLTLPQDWSKLIALTSKPAIRQARAPYFWGWYDVRADRLSEYGPVPAADLQRRFL